MSREIIRRTGVKFTEVEQNAVRWEYVPPTGEKLTGMLTRSALDQERWDIEGVPSTGVATYPRMLMECVALVEAHVLDTEPPQSGSHGDLDILFGP